MKLLRNLLKWYDRPANRLVVQMLLDQLDRVFTDSAVDVGVLREEKELLRGRLESAESMLAEISNRLEVDGFYEALDEIDELMRVRAAVAPKVRRLGDGS